LSPFGNVKTVTLSLTTPVSDEVTRGRWRTGRSSPIEVERRPSSLLLSLHPSLYFTEEPPSG
jgi:hypothetical protein